MSSPTPDSPATPDSSPDAAPAVAPDSVPATAQPADAFAEPTAETTAESTAEATASQDAPEKVSDAEKSEADEPQDVTLLVDPARVRRAPKYPVFLWMGVLVGAVVGLVFATWLIDAVGAAESLMKPGVYVAVTVIGTAALGLGVAGVLALLADRRSLRRR